MYRRDPRCPAAECGTSAAESCKNARNEPAFDDHPAPAPRRGQRAATGGDRARVLVRERALGDPLARGVRSAGDRARSPPPGARPALSARRAGRLPAPPRAARRVRRDARRDLRGPAARRGRIPDPRRVPRRREPLGADVASAAVRAARADRADPGQAVPVRRGGAGGRASARDVPPRRRGGRGAGRRDAALSGRHEAVRGGGLQAPARDPARRRRDARGAACGVPPRSRVRPNAAGADPRRRRLPLDRRQLRRSRWGRARHLLRAQAAPGAGRGRDVSRRRCGVGRRGRRLRPPPAARARVSRHLTGRVQARPARRHPAAHGGERAPLAVAFARRGMRRRPGADGLPRRDRRTGHDPDEPGGRRAPVGGARPSRAREPPRASRAPADAGAAPSAVLRAGPVTARPDARRPRS